jgi:RNA polymerase sigma factor (sigma-70 family)
VAREPIGVSGRYLRTLFDVGVTSGLTDGQLLERFASHRGQTAELAFAALVQRHGPMVLGTCRGIVNDDHEAMDAFQATFLVLVRKGKSLWVRDSLGPWLHRVACRAAARARADAGRRRRLERRAAERLPGSSRPGERDDLATVVHEELDRLPDRYRLPIVLCDLEGYTCEQAARHIGCPLGTVGSRLARGRQRLRRRLARRGLAPTAGALGEVLSSESNGATVPAALAESTVNAAASKNSVAGALLARAVLRGMIMKKWTSVAAAVVAGCGVSVLAAWAIRPIALAQDPPPKAGKQTNPDEPFPFMNDKVRMKDFVYAEIGNMRPLIKDARGVRFQSREAIVYKDGTAKLWSTEQKDPVAPPLRHKGPIQELTFFDEANCLITLSDESVKIWDALTGEFRKELEHQTISPLWLSFAPSARRFATLDAKRKAATVWDAASMSAIGTVQLDRTAPIPATGLSGDGKTLVTFRFGALPTIELWDVASGRSFATVRGPSAVIADVFTPDGKGLHRAGLQGSVSARDTPFWEAVRLLAPAGTKGRD